MIATFFLIYQKVAIISGIIYNSCIFSLFSHGFQSSCLCEPLLRKRYDMRKLVFTCLLQICFWPNLLFAQPPVIDILHDFENGIASIDIDQKHFTVSHHTPIISYMVNETQCSSMHSSSSIKVSFEKVNRNDAELQWLITFSNISKDTIQLHNVHPFALPGADALITGMGNHGLSRTHLFLPGRMPVNVIVPDNAWDLGYASIPISEQYHVAALTRRNRTSIIQGARRRFETVLYPGGSVTYNFYAISYSGEWQSGLKRIFNEKMLFDVEAFNDSLFQRKDLQWIRHTYVMHLMYAWDKFYYDINGNR